MAQSSASPNNIAVKFRGQSEREMPSVSKSQNAAMHAAAAGKSTLGIPKKVGAEFVKNQKPGSVKKLPQHVRKAHKSGLISDASLKKHYGG